MPYDDPESVIADASSAHVAASSLVTPTLDNKNNNSSGRQISQSQSSSPTPSHTTTEAATTSTTTIVDEAQECLAQSLFMFLYADLRLLSATGRINTKFETLCIDSDKVQRTTSAQMAQLVEKAQAPPWEIGSCEGVSPGQVMAILFVELRQEVLAQRKRAKEQLKERGWVPNFTALSDTDDDDDDDAGLLNKITDRKGRKEFETDMHALIRSYNDMLAHDLRGIPEVKMEKAQPKLMGNDNTPFLKSWLFPNQLSHRLFSADDGDQPLPQQHDLASNYDNDDEEGSKNSKTNAAVERFRNVAMLLRKTPFGTSQGRGLHNGDDDGCELATKRNKARETRLSQIDETPESSGLGETTIASDESKSISQNPARRKSGQKSVNECNNIEKRVPDPMESPGPTHSSIGSPKLHIGPGITKHLSTYVEKIREDQVLHHRLIIPADDYETFAGAEDVGNKLVQMTSSLNLPRSCYMPPERASSSEADAGRNMSESELLDFMTKCIESRNTHSLDFMADFFRDNTVSQTMVKSEAQVVWLQDWFQIKDCIYAISVDKKKKRVLVLFRGATTRADWNHAFDTSMKRGHNPVKDEYEGKTPHLKVHSGFYSYLFRIRKDTHTRKYDEIANKVYEYGHKMIGSDFTVTVNGYSLGGALSLLFGFYASTDERFTAHGPVKIFTYGMPYCVGHSFADAFRHQEKKRMVQHARFYNNNDIVSHLPFNLTPTKRGSSFVHVGIDVKLYPVPGKLSVCGSRYPKIRYNEHESAMRAYLTALRMNSLLNMAVPWRIKHVHSLPQLQKRIARAILVAEVAKATKNPFLRSTLDEAYEAMVYSRKEK